MGPRWAAKREKNSQEKKNKNAERASKHELRNGGNKRGGGIGGKTIVHTHRGCRKKYLQKGERVFGNRKRIKNQKEENIGWLIKGIKQGSGL